MHRACYVKLSCATVDLEWNFRVWDLQGLWLWGWNWIEQYWPLGIQLDRLLSELHIFVDNALPLWIRLATSWHVIKCHHVKIERFFKIFMTFDDIWMITFHDMTFIMIILCYPPNEIYILWQNWPIVNFLITWFYMENIKKIILGLSWAIEFFWRL